MCFFLSMLALAISFESCCDESCGLYNSGRPDICCAMLASDAVLPFGFNLLLALDLAAAALSDGFAFAPDFMLPPCVATDQ